MTWGSYMQRGAASEMFNVGIPYEADVTIGAQSRDSGISNMYAEIAVGGNRSRFYAHRGNDEKERLVTFLEENGLKPALGQS